jgi:hypothetical protein
MTNIRRTFLEKLCFDSMADIVTIELGFGQQVADEVRKNFPKLSSAAEVARVSTAAECFL